MRDCPQPSKRCYQTKAKAKLALSRMRCTDRDSLHAYRCGCGVFHIGHKPGSRRRPNLGRGNGAEAVTETSSARHARPRGELA